MKKYLFSMLLILALVCAIVGCVHQSDSPTKPQTAIDNASVSLSTAATIPEYAEFKPILMRFSSLDQVAEAKKDSLNTPPDETEEAKEDPYALKTLDFYYISKYAEEHWYLLGGELYDISMITRYGSTEDNIQSNFMLYMSRDNAPAGAEFLARTIDPENYGNGIAPQPIIDGVYYEEIVNWDSSVTQFHWLHDGYYCFMKVDQKLMDEIWTNDPEALKGSLFELRKVYLNGDAIPDTPPDSATPSSAPTLPQTQAVSVVPLFRYYYYYSIDEFYKDMAEFSEGELDHIRQGERSQLEETSQKTLMSEMEKEEGIFEHWRNRLLETKTLMLPFYKGQRIYFPKGQSISMLNNKNEEVEEYITLYPSDFAAKPEISYGGYVENKLRIVSRIQFYNEDLIEEANEKGAAWLMAQLEPDELNLYNVEEYNQKLQEHATEKYSENISVYEKAYSLGDRDVTAMVVDQSLRVGAPPLLNIFFVYDDLLISVTFLTEELQKNNMSVEDVFANLTFYEVYLPDSTVVRDTPGKEWSKWSTRPYPPSPDNIPQPDNPDTVSVPDSAAPTPPPVADTVPSTPGGDVPSVPNQVTPPDAVPTAVNPPSSASPPANP